MERLLVMDEGYTDVDRKAIVDLSFQGIMSDYNADPQGATVRNIKLSRVAVAMYDVINGAKVFGSIDDQTERVKLAFKRHYPEEAEALKI